MPLYDYKCTTCGNKFESFSTMAGKNEVLCPLCGGVTQTLVTCKGFTPFKEEFWESLGDVVSSKQDLVQKCKAKGLIALDYM